MKYKEIKMKKYSAPLILELAANGFFVARNKRHQGKLEQTRFHIHTAASLIPTRSLDGLVNELLKVEKEAWSPTMRTSILDIKSRIRRYPEGQYIATLDEKIVGVLYTQRIASRTLLTENQQGSTCAMTYERQGDLHEPSGLVLQLLSVAVVEVVSTYQIGSTIRDLAINYAYASGINEVIAMTRCSGFSGKGTEEDYYKYIKSHCDQTLRFHEIGGAKVILAIRNFRRKDTTNLGHAVLVSYDLPTLAKSESHKAVASIKIPVLNEYILWNIITSLADPKVLGKDLAVVMTTTFLDMSFMDMGLDSLNILDLRAKLDTYLDKTLSTSPLLLFEYPTPRLLLKFISTGGDKNQNDTTKRKDEIIEIGKQLHRSDDLAVIGMSCRFPGGNNSPEEFFKYLETSGNAVTNVPLAWDSSGRKYGAFLDAEDAETFVPGAYGLTSTEAEQMDPHQRIVMQVTYEALAKANLMLQEKGNKTIDKVGVFVGLCNNEWNRRLIEYESPHSSATSAYTGVGIAAASVANRISFLLGFTGPSLIIDSACSSSLTALHAACQGIQNKDCSVAVIAAADLLISPFSLDIRSAAGMLSPNGMTRSFDAAANGYVRGEGAGAVVIKRLLDAEADEQNGGPPVLAVIRATAINQNGRSATLTAPNIAAQRSVMEEALQRAAIRDRDVDYIEAHGSGTSLGDPIEWQAIRDVYLRSNNPSSPMIIGAVKTNIGHLEGASGMAGLIKAILCLRNKKVPGNLHMDKVNPLINGKTERNFVLPTATIQLESNKTTYFAAVSSFGSGGSNAHIILQDYQKNRLIIDETDSTIGDKTSKTKKYFSQLHTEQDSKAERRISWRGYVRSQAVIDNKQQELQAIKDKPHLQVERIKRIVLETVRETIRDLSIDISNLDSLISIEMNTPLDSLGIDSLAMIEIRNRLASSFELTEEFLPSTLLFMLPSASKITKLIVETLANQSSKIVKHKKSRLSCDTDKHPKGVEKASITSKMQQTMLFHNLLNPESRTYVETFIWQTSGSLDYEDFRNAWISVICSEEILRASFATEAVPVAKQYTWSAKVLSLESECIDGGNPAWFNIKQPVAISEKLLAIESLVREERLTGLDITKPPLLRISVLPFTDSAQNISGNAVILNIHHLLIDGWSMKTLLESLASAYGSRKDFNGLKKVSLSKIISSGFESFSELEYTMYEEDNTSQVRMDAENHWRYLFADWQRPVHYKGFKDMKCDLNDSEIVRYGVHLKDNEIEPLRAIARLLRVTVASVLQTIWSMTLSTIVDVEAKETFDLVYGCTVSGRSIPLAGINTIIGPVVNTIPVRIKLPASIGDEQDFNSYSMIIQSLHAQLMGSLVHESYPLARIKKLIIGAQGVHLFSGIFDYQRQDWSTSILSSSVKLEHGRLVDSIGCPLSMRVLDGTDGMQINITSESSCMRLDKLQEFATRYLSTLNQIILAYHKGKQFNCTPQPIDHCSFKNGGNP